MLLSALKFISRTKPLSTTASTSSIVTDDSAIVVDRMIFIFPSGAGVNTCCCSSCGTCECNGRMMSVSRWAAGSASRTFIVSLISSQPGRKTKTLPFRPLLTSSAATSRATSAASATTSSSRSRLSPIFPPPPPAAFSPRARLRVVPFKATSGWS
eukprot:31121-Pelagococcus_subviridis.AAC.4